MAKTHIFDFDDDDDRTKQFDDFANRHSRADIRYAILGSDQAMLIYNEEEEEEEEEKKGRDFPFHFRTKRGK